MFTKCATCNGTILAGGETFLNWGFCGEECSARFRAHLVDQVLPKEVVGEQVRRVLDAPCPSCGEPSKNDIYKSTKVSAFLVIFRVNTERQVCCSGCGRKNRLKAAIHCLFAGWWGPKAALVNLFALPTNLIAALAIRSPSGPSNALLTMIKASMADAMAPQIMASLQNATDLGQTTDGTY